MSQGDFEKLTLEQQKAVEAWRNRIGELITQEGDAFCKEHPELRLTWNFTSEPLIRGLHPVIFEEL